MDLLAVKQVKIKMTLLWKNLNSYNIFPAFRERATGRTYNRDQPTGEGEDTRPGRNQDRGRGRGRYGPRRGGDRHSRTGVA